MLLYIYKVKRGGYDKVAIDLAAECVTAAAEFYADAHKTSDSNICNSTQ